ncbi:MAG TPA: glutamine synthetase family protein [Bacteroidales bacterium]|nr:glutamine synthetase family protein [Bacteroidales bacterium]HPS62568.1 glutamine synthetase family protein [Bacteroidales bacterium]
MNDYISLNPNPIVHFLGKPSDDFTKADLMRFIEANGIRMLNFRYSAADSRLKTLNFIIKDRHHLDSILSAGERVDGSSLFPNYVQAGSSDLYVIPRYRSAFVNPFSEIPAVDILCSYYDKDGQPFANSPEHILRRSHEALKRDTGFSFEVMGELEYYIISAQDRLFEAVDQRGYHESSPFCKWEKLRIEAMNAIAACGGFIKYGHSEVGNFTESGLSYEQNEIEFTPVKLEDAADQLLVAKWILRSLAYKYGVTVTFAPKITTGKAGSGMHVHTRLMKDGKSVMVENGKLSDTARKAIAGYLDLSQSLTAFGNMIPTSYFRLVPHQEAPTNICWGDRNRSVLVRVPLGWGSKHDMITDANPQETDTQTGFGSRQTVEFRCPDGSADIYLLCAGLTVAARHGIQMEHALEFAEKTYVDVNIFEEKHKSRVSELQQLPFSCWDSAEALERQRKIYEESGVFPPAIIDGIIRYLKKFNDQQLRESIKDNEKEIMKLVNTYLHCG